MPLGFLGTGTSSIAIGVSGDGSTAVGYGRSSSGRIEAIRWSSGTPTGLGFLESGNLSQAIAVSDDGSVVAGAGSYNASGQVQAFRWKNGVMAGLGFLGTGTKSAAYGISADGRVLVGTSTYDASGRYQAFRWENEVMTGLGFLGSGKDSIAYDISADGWVLAGASSYDASGRYQAFRWENGTMDGLGFLEGGNQSTARSVSGNGKVVVGYSTYDASGKFQAFRWENGTMSGLGFLGSGSDSHAYSTNADGSVVVGSSTFDGGGKYRAFRWSAATRLQPVTQWLAGAGIALPAGWSLIEAVGINANGNVVAGYGTDAAGHTQAWLARVDPTGSGLLTDIPAYNATLVEAGSRAVRAGIDLPNLTLFGAHHRSLLDNGLARTTPDGTCAWATADGARYRRTDTRAELAEIGACKDFGSARMGIGIGQAWTQQDWSLGGSARYDGQYLLLEAANAFASGLQPSLTGYYGRFNTHLHRRYLNGASLDGSRASPDARSYALRARLDWKDAAALGGFSLSPYAAYTLSHTQLDAYAETGGGFPAQFAESRWRTHELRAGAVASTALSAATGLSLGLEAAHWFDNGTDGVNGHVAGLWDFALPGQRDKQTWVRAMLDIDHRIDDHVMFTAGAHAGSGGGDANWGLTAGLRAHF